MIQKDKLIQKIIKSVKISQAKATQAYEIILKEEAAFRKQSLKTVETKIEKAVKVAGKTEIKKVELVKEVPVKMVNTVEKIKPVEVVKEVPVEVVKVVEKIKEVKVVQQVPVEKIKEVIKEVRVVKEVPVEVIKEVTLVKEVHVPVEKIVEKVVEKKVEVKVPVVKVVEKKVEVKVPVVKVVEKKVEVKVVDQKAVNKAKELAAELALWQRDYNSLYKTATAYEKEIGTLKSQLKAKPKEVVKEVIKKVIKEVKVPVVKEVIKKVPYEVIKQVKVRDDKEINRLKALLKEKPKEVIKTVIKEVPVEVVKEVEVVKGIDINQLKMMMSQMKTKEVSKKVIGESRSEKEAVLVTKREVKAGTNQLDDLTKIEGVGPKIAELLGRNKIFTFVELAKMKSESIKSILDKAGSKFSMHDPKSWPQQASLAAAGKWTELQKLQEKLIGGK